MGSASKNVSTNLTTLMHEGLFLVTTTSPKMVETIDIYPPTKEPDVRILFITLYLIGCLTLGLCGNFSQLMLQYYAYRLRIYDGDSSPNCTQLYIAFLHLSYFFISISLPTIIIENLVQNWMFGIVSCIGHFLLVNAGRTSAAWLTVMLFYDQLRVLKKEESTYAQNKKFFIRSLAIIFVICLFSILPSLVNVKVVEEILEEDKNEQVHLKVRTFKCTSKMSPDLALYSSAINFVMDYALPLFLIFLISCKIEWHTYRNRTMTIIYSRRVQNLRIIAAILFMFGYAPYWLAISYLHFANTLRIQISEFESQLLADLALLFQYSLPIIIWYPLSQISSFVSKQAQFYDTATKHWESYRETSGGYSWAVINKKNKEKCSTYGLECPPISMSQMNMQFLKEEKLSPTSTSSMKISSRRLLSADDCYDVNL